jgi:hypothetical protein
MKELGDLIVSRQKMGGFGEFEFEAAQAEDFLD